MTSYLHFSPHVAVEKLVLNEKRVRRPADGGYHSRHGAKATASYPTHFYLYLLLLLYYCSQPVLTLDHVSLEHAQPLNGLLAYPRGLCVPTTPLFVAGDRFQQLYVLNEIYEENAVLGGSVSPVNRELLARASD